MPDVRDLVAEIRQAVERYPPQALVDILVYIFKQYVVEGPAPLDGATAGTVAPDEELDGSSFAALMRSLQLRYDLPELELFDVQGERVLLRSGGRLIPVEAARAAPEVAAAPPPSARPATSGPAAPSVMTVEREAQRSPAVDANAPAPSRVSPTASPRAAAPVEGRPASAAAPPSAAEARPASAPAPVDNARPPSAPAAAPAKPAEGGAPPRTGLLEID
jgi:hypothetical protein